MENFIEHVCDDFDSREEVSRSFTSCVSGQVCLALNQLLSNYKDKKIGLRLLAKKIGIHEKTVLRLLKLENEPGYKTVIKVFRVFYNEYDDEKLLCLLPDIIRDYIVQSSPQKITATNVYPSNADLEIQKNPVMAEIYALVGTGPIHEDEILCRFGQYGSEVLRRMAEMQMIKETNRGLYILGPNQAEFSAGTIMSVSRALIDSHTKLSNAEVKENNFLGFYAEGLTTEAYQEWLQIDEDAFRKKVELSKKKHKLGHIRAFTFMVTETMEIKGL